MSAFWPNPPGPTGLFWLTPTSLPFWYFTQTAIGSAAGSFSVSSGTYTVAATGGSGIAGTSDSLFFANQPASSNMELIAYVSSQTGTNAYATSGLMISDLSSTYPAATQCAMIGVSTLNGVNFSFRTADNTAADTTLGPSISAPVWLRLVVTQSSVLGYSSPDGIAWRLVGQCSMNLPSTYYAGLAVYSNVGGTTNTATFTNVYRLTNVPQRVISFLPSWTQNTIGGASGSFSANSDGSFTVGGSGTGVTPFITPLNDVLFFANQQTYGDVQIIAEVTAMTGTDAAALGGIMISDMSTSYPTASQCAVMGVTKSNGGTFVWRETDNTTPLRQQVTGAAPLWVRLQVLAGVVNGYQSTDGQNWSVVGAGNITVPASYAMGLVAWSNTSSVNSVTFNNVSCQQDANMLSWLRDDAGITYDGSNKVSLWTDQSFNAISAYQATTANQPSLTTSAINGLPAVCLNGLSGFLQYPTGFASFVQGLTIFILINPASITAGSQILNLGTSSGNAYNLGIQINSASKAEYFVYDSTGTTVTRVAWGAAMTTVPQLIEVVHSGATATIFTNGINPVINYAMNAIPNPTAGRTNNYIGQAASGGNYFNGQVAEVLIYQRVLDPEERLAIESYFHGKFSV